MEKRVGCKVTSIFVLLVILAAGFAFPTTSDAQVDSYCSIRWTNPELPLLGPGTPIVYTAVVRTDGKVVLGGTFTAPGQRVLLWDPATNATSPLGNGLGGTVWALAKLQDGTIVAGGEFPGGVARWTGTTWEVLGTGLDNRVASLIVMPNGDLVAGGYFTERIARWDGSSWHGMPDSTANATALASGPILALFVDHNGDLIAGGGNTFNILQSPGSTVITGFANIARWDGANWQPIGDQLDAIINSISEIKVSGVYHLVVAIQTFSFQSPLVVTAFLNGQHWQRLAGNAESVYSAALLPLGHFIFERSPGILLLIGDFRNVDGQPGTSIVTDLVPSLGGTESNGNQILQWNYTGLRPFVPTTGTIDGVDFVGGNLLGDTFNAIKLSDGRILMMGRGHIINTSDGSSGLDAFISLARFPQTADFNCSWTDDVPDIFDFMNAWLSNDYRADINHSTRTEVADIFDFLNIWFGTIYQSFPAPSDITPPTTPTLIAPANGVPITAYTPVTLSWLPAHDESTFHYELQIDNDQSFSLPLYLQSNFVTTTSYFFSSGFSLGTYYWRVRAVDDIGNYGNYSNVRSFRIP